jgi:phage terminase large subunit
MQKIVKTNPVYSPYFKDQSRILIFYGGAGSGKSVFVSSKILRRACEETPHKILVIRKVANTIKDSVYAELIERISEWGIYNHVVVNKTDKTFTFDNGNVIICKGLDEPEKIKSIQGITSIWIEEATELKEEDFDQLLLRVRGEKKNYVQFILSFNPIDENHWIKKRLIDSGEATFVHTTYKDNVFLDQEYKDSLNALKETNSLYYQIYCLGEWGIVDTSNKFLYAFNQELHVNPCSLDESIPVKLTFDFNLEPFAVTVYQTPDKDTSNFIDKIRLNDSDIYQVCDHIKAKYPNHFFIVTGDASGKNRSGTARGKTSYWRIIKSELNLRDAQIRLRGKNLGLIESRVLCNSALQHKNINIDPSLTELINDCKYSIVDETGILVKDRKEYKNDFLDGLRYALDAEYPTLISNPKNLNRK